MTSPHRSGGAEPGRGGAAWKMAAGVFCGWVALGSIASGAASALRTGYGLERFGGLGYVPRILALEVPRESAPRLAVTSACFALVAWASGCAQNVSSSSWRARAWIPFALVPPATLLAAVLALLGGLGALAGAYGVPVTGSFTTLMETAEPVDFAHGLARSAILAAAFGAAAVVAGPFPVLARGSPSWKLALAWVGVTVVAGALDLGLDAVWPNPRAYLVPPGF